jgi:hypothetical protein
MKAHSDYELMISSLNAGYVGGGYYNPVDEFVRISRPLSSERLEGLLKSSEMSLVSGGEPTYFISNVYAELQSLIKSGEILFALYDKGKYKMSVYIHGEERLLDFEQQIQLGTLTRCGFFVVDYQNANEGLVREFIPSIEQRSR